MGMDNAIKADTVTLAGSTYQHKDALKAIGATWDGSAWTVSAEALSSPRFGSRKVCDLRKAIESGKVTVKASVASMPICPACGTVCYGDCRS